MNIRIKVLLSAYACEPHKGSEPHVGWSWSRSLAQFCDVTVITRTNNKGPIEAALAETEEPKPRMIYYDPPAWIVRLKRHGLPIGLFYLIWQIGARLKMSRGLDSYDIVHHITFNSFLLPGFWWQHHPKAVLGPLGGGMTTPTCMLPLFGVDAWREMLRTWTVRLGLFMPALLISLKAARVVIAANQDTKQVLSTVCPDKVMSMIDAGIHAAQVQPGLKTETGGSLRLIWVGRLEARKAPILALKAFALAAAELGSATLEFVGDGPQRAMLEKLGSSLGLGDRVHFCGRLAHPDAVAKFREADIFLFTSLRDTSGNVLLEAMASGLPSVIVSHQGAKEIASQETAIHILPGKPDDVARQLAEGILALASDPWRRHTMGQAAQRRILECYTWDIKALRMVEIYRQALEERS